MSTVRTVTQRNVPKTGVLCLALAHNEARRMEDFLRHHRELGIVHFLIVDDGSTDGTAEFLQAQADVTLFVPDGTSYREHKGHWRREILDAHAAGRWVILPDLDELFVYPFCNSRSIADLAEHLDAAGAEAVFAPMVEMYADAPLDQSFYRPGQSMLTVFPYFDTSGYRLVSGKRRFVKRFPTPPLDMHGGPRERLFYNFKANALSAPRRWALKRFAHIRRSLRPTRVESAGNMVARLAVAAKAPRPPLIMSKIGLIKWRHGLRFSGGPHSVSQPLALADVWGALLHFKFIDLPGDVAYAVQRQQHAGGAHHYKALEARGDFGRSPLYEGSRRYTSWKDLLGCGLLRSSAEWENAAVTQACAADHQRRKLARLTPAI